MIRTPSPAIALLVLAAGCAPAVSPSVATSTAAPMPSPADMSGFAEAYRDLSFGEFTGNRFLSELPVRFRIPAGYVAVRAEQATRTYWTSPADSARQAADPEAPLNDGFYSVALSLNVGYDRERDLFFGADGDETTMRRGFEAQGFTGVVLERHRVNGYPVLFIEAEKDGRRARLAYVAALVDTNAVFTYYTHPDPFREIDEARWREFKRAILASPPPAP